ncbi:MAG: DUF3108 domain-containing protein [Myxococcales bacterium]|nr:DUF3108 domain-containing protein [Myxococcales bacterium]
MKLLTSLVMLWGSTSAYAAGVAAKDVFCNGVLPMDDHPSTELRAGERLEYKLSFSGMYLGRLELAVGALRKVEGQLALPLVGRLRTNSFVSAIRPVEGRYMAMVDPGSLQPFGVRVESQVGDDPRWEKIRFTSNGRRVDISYLYQGQERRRVYTGDHTIVEGLSLLHIARRVPLRPGLTGCQDILSTRRMWRVRAKVLAMETVATPAGPKRAYRVRATMTQRRLRQGKKKPFSVDMDILIGDLPGRPPLAFEMRSTKSQKVSGKADLIRWKRGRRTTAKRSLTGQL